MYENPGPTKSHDGKGRSVQWILQAAKEHP